MRPRRPSAYTDSEIPYLLDPCYSSAFPTSPCASASSSYESDARVYLDAQGRAHDPRYRMFVTSPSSSRQDQQRQRVHPPFGAYQPDEEDEEEEQFIPYPSAIRRSSIELNPLRPTTSHTSWTRSRSPAYTSVDGMPSYIPPDPESPFTAHRIIEDEDEPEVGPSNVPVKRASSARSDDEEATTSCIPSLRTKWETVTLRMQMSLFHTKRRFAGRIRAG